MNRLPNLSSFNNLNRLSICSNSIKGSFRLPRSLSGLRYLHLRSAHTCRSFASQYELRELQLRTLRVEYSSQLEIETQADLIWLASMPKLVALKADSCEVLRLAGVGQGFRLDTLAGLPALRDLTLLAPRRLENFDFVARCPRLENLCVSTNSLTTTDLTGLLDSQRPLELCFPAASKAVKQRLSQNPSLRLIYNDD